MNTLESVYLNGKSFNDYLQGAEVDSKLSTTNKNMQPGQHVMVFKNDPVTATGLIATADKASENVGVEGTVLKVAQVTDMNRGDVEQHLKIKRL
jgi:hypothetical protein